MKGRLEAALRAFADEAAAAAYAPRIERGTESRHAMLLELELLCGLDCPPELQVPLSCPDNLVFDPGANLWVATDGQGASIDRPDGLFAITIEGPDRGHVRPFASLPPGAECTGPEFTPDGKALFLAVQHPGDGGTFEKPKSRFPDGHGPPRPTVVCIVRDDGGPIGT